MNKKSIIKGTFVFDPKDKIYRDHFPGNPIVPGSLIVNAFLESIKRIYPGKKINSAKNFKFKAFISPGEYEYIIRQVEYGYKCNLYLQEKIVAAGNLQYET